MEQNKKIATEMWKTSLNLLLFAFGGCLLLLFFVFRMKWKKRAKKLVEFVLFLTAAGSALGIVKVAIQETRFLNGLG